MTSDIECSFEHLDPSPEPSGDSKANGDYMNHVKKVRPAEALEIAEFGTIDELKAAVKACGSAILNQFDTKGLHMLHRAAKNDDPVVFSFVITGGECESVNELTQKLEKSDLTTLKFDPCHRTLNPENTTPIHMACKNGNIQVVELLLAAGVSIELRDGRLKTPLLVATYSGKLELVIFLISKGADVNAEDEEHDSCLHWAAYIGDSRLIKMFLSFGLDVNKADDFLQTPVHLVCSSRKLPALELVLEQSPNLSLLDKKRRSPIAVANDKGFLAGVSKLGVHTNGPTLIEKITLALFPYNITRAYVGFFFLYFGFWMLNDQLSHQYYYRYFHITKCLKCVIWIFLFSMILFHLKKCWAMRFNQTLSNLDEYHKLFKMNFTHESLSNFLLQHRICHICQVVADDETIHCPFKKRCIRGYDQYDFIFDISITKRNRLLFLRLYFWLLLYYIYVLLFCFWEGKWLFFIICYLWAFGITVVRFAVLYLACARGVPSYQVNERIAEFFLRTLTRTTT